MRRNHPYRQEAVYELEDTALAVKENKNCIYKYIRQSEHETSSNYEKDQNMA